MEEQNVQRAASVADLRAGCGCRGGGSGASMPLVSQQCIVGSSFKVNNLPQIASLRSLMHASDDFFARQHNFGA
jgi:hypothetical protein